MGKTMKGKLRGKKMKFFFNWEKLQHTYMPEGMIQQRGKYQVNKGQNLVDKWRGGLARTQKQNMMSTVNR